jgi:hypothetical protein
VKVDVGFQAMERPATDVAFSDEIIFLGNDENRGAEFLMLTVQNVHIKHAEEDHSTAAKPRGRMPSPAASPTPSSHDHLAEAFTQAARHAALQDATFLQNFNSQCAQGHDASAEVASSPTGSMMSQVCTTPRASVESSTPSVDAKMGASIKRARQSHAREAKGGNFKEQERVFSVRVAWEHK